MTNETKNLSSVTNEIPISHQMVIHSLFNRPVASHFGTLFTDKSMTQQQFAEECDLNNIVDKNFQLKDPAFITKLQLRSGQQKNEPIYGDFTSVSDYQSSVNIVNQARNQFMSLPSKVRAYFDNDPQKLLEFCNNPDNYEEGVRLGIFKSKPAEINQSITSPNLGQSEQLQQNVGNAGQQTVSAPSGETSA